MVDEPKITLKVRLDNIFQMISNKVTSWSQTPSDNKYPSEKLVKNSLDGKVDKVTGKGLSTNDFSGYYKGMIDNLSEVATTGDYNDLDNAPSIPRYTSELNNDGDGGDNKYVVDDVISDVAMSGSYGDLTNKPNYTPTITSSTTGSYKIGSINVSGSNVDIYGKDIDTVYTHPTYSDVAKSTSAIYKFKTNSLGHIIEISTVSASDLPSHNHDDRYYTEEEVVDFLNKKIDLDCEFIDGWWTSNYTYSLKGNSVKDTNTLRTDGKKFIYKVPDFSDMHYDDTELYLSIITTDYKYGIPGKLYYNGNTIYVEDAKSLFMNKYLLIECYRDGNFDRYRVMDIFNIFHNHNDIYYSKSEIDNKIITDVSELTDNQGLFTEINDDIASKAPTSHASSSTTYGVATSSNYGHTKVINNLTTLSNNNGEALSAYQGKVLNDNKLARDSIDIIEGTEKNNSLYNCISFYSGEGDGQVMKGNGTVILQAVGHNSVFLIDMNKLKAVIDFNDAEDYKICDFTGYSQFSDDGTTYSNYISGGKIYGTVINGRLVISVYDNNDNEIFYTNANYMPSYVYIHMQTNQMVTMMTMSNIDNIIGVSEINAIANIVYPVGSIYMSMNSTSPQTLFGGVWERLKDRFLLGVGDTYSEDSTGGSATVTLTSAQSGVPAHSHKYQDYNTTYTLKTTNRKPGTSTAVAYGTSLTSGGGATERTSSNNTTANASESHENMPPYLTVYMWKRIV